MLELIPPMVSGIGLVCLLGGWWVAGKQGALAGGGAWLVIAAAAGLANIAPATNVILPIFGTLVCWVLPPKPVAEMQAASPAPLRAAAPTPAPAPAPAPVASSAENIQLNQVLEKLETAVIIMDANGRITWCNTRARTFAELGDKEISGKSLFSAFRLVPPPEDEPDDEFQTSTDTENNSFPKLLLMRKSGPMELSHRRHTIAPGVEVVELQDIRDVVALEQRLKAKKREASKQAKRRLSLLFDSARLLRTPMAGLLGSADLLVASGSLPADELELANAIRLSALAMRDALEDMAQLARAEGRAKIRLTAIDVEREFASLASLRQASGQKGQIQIAIADGVPARFKVSRSVLWQAVNVGLTHADRDENAGGALVLGGSLAEGSFLASIEWAGTPYTEVQMQSWMNPDPGDLDKSLSIAARLLSKHEGTMTIQATEAGNRIEIRLPAETADDAPEESVLQSGGHILVVEDDPTNRLVLTRMVKHLGYTVTEATDGAEALALLDVETFHAVLMDLELPRVDGFEATRGIRARGHRGPIIAISAHVDRPEVRDRAIRAGMDDFLGKPVDLAGLRMTLDRFTSNLLG